MANTYERAEAGKGSDRFEVLIAGAGVAGLEAAFALREFAGERVSVKLLAPTEEFVYRPMSIGEPFLSSSARRFPLSGLAAEADAQLLEDALLEVDTGNRLARTAGGAEVRYDALLICLGASSHPRYEHATTVDDARMDELLHGLVQDLEEGYVRRLAIVVPAPMPWPLPAYELALMSSERAWDMQAEMRVTVLTPESMPLAVFGREASLALSGLLAERQIDVVTSAYCEIPKAKTVIVHPGKRSMEFDRVVALPELRGPDLSGLPQDGGGFIPVDEYGAVRDVERVWAAGDATDFPIKHGGLAAQLADTAAASIAALAGAAVQPGPFHPTIEGVLLTGGTPRYLRGQPTGGHGADSALTKVLRGAELPKIAARYLTPHLEDLQSPGMAALS